MQTMKKICTSGGMPGPAGVALALVVVSVCSAAAALATEALRLSEPVEVGPGYAVFGTPMAPMAPTASLGAIIRAAKDHQGREVRVSTKVRQGCQKKGGVFIAIDQELWARVTFRDYAFFVPTDIAGREVEIEGVFSSQTLTAAQAAHYAADLGEKVAAPSGEVTEYAILATSVLVREGS